MTGNRGNRGVTPERVKESESSAGGGRKRKAASGECWRLERPSGERGRDKPSTAGQVRALQRLETERVVALMNGLERSPSSAQLLVNQQRPMVDDGLKMEDK